MGTDINIDAFTDEYMDKMKDKFDEALKEAKEEDAEELKEIMKNFSEELKVLVTSTDEERKKIAYGNTEIYKAILMDYKAIESLRFTNLILDGINIGIGMALKVAITAL